MDSKYNAVVWAAVNEPFAIVHRRNELPKLAIRFYDTTGVVTAAEAKPRQLELTAPQVERLVQFIRSHPDSFDLIVAAVDPRPGVRPPTSEVQS